MQENVIFRYRTLRKFVGFIAFFIPFICIWSIYIAQHQLIFPTSISVTYHLGAQDVFVGMLTIVGIFLLSYNGHKPVNPVKPSENVILRWLFKWLLCNGHWESLKAKIAGLGALAVAYFPTRFNINWLCNNDLMLMNFPHLSLDKLREIGMVCNDNGSCYIAMYDWVWIAHIVGAVILIFILFMFCINFARRAKRKLDEKNWPENNKANIKKWKILWRYRLYLVSTIIMGGSLLIFLPLNFVGPYKQYAMMYLEVGCLWGFALCWFTAGSDFLREKDDVEANINQQFWVLDELDQQNKQS